MSTKSFWESHKISTGRDQPGNPKSKEEKKPSQHTDLSPEKAEKMLHEGKVRGHKITPKQRGFFGAVASKKR